MKQPVNVYPASQDMESHFMVFAAQSHSTLISTANHTTIKENVSLASKDIILMNIITVLKEAIPIGIIVSNTAILTQTENISIHIKKIVLLFVWNVKMDIILTGKINVNNSHKTVKLLMKLEPVLIVKKIINLMKMKFVFSLMKA